MRLVPGLAALALLAGCASNDYSKVPEPTGEWVPANPPSLMAQTPALEAPAPIRAAWRRRPPARPVRAVALSTATAP